MSCSNATVAPLVLPVRSLTFAGNNFSRHRWVGIDLGSPPQPRYFKLSTADDSLSVADQRFCTNGNEDEQCAALYGGFYQSELSDTYQAVSENQWNGSHVQISRTPARWFNDMVRIAGHTIWGYPVLQYTSRLNWGNMLGINNASYFLSFAEISGLAPTRSWGLWVGNGDTDGSLVIGGYDEARISEDVGHFALRSPFGNEAQVTRIAYYASNGSRVTLLQDVDGIAVALSPEDPTMQLPSSAFNKLVSTTGAVQYPSPMSWGWPVGTDLGNITIEFLNKYKVTLPARDLWQPFEGYDSAKKTVVSNDSVLISHVSNRTDGGRPNLGVPFFKSVYMRYHPEEGNFDLAAANTDPDLQPSIQSFCSAIATGGSETSANSSPRVGAIVGGVLGGILALALCALLVWVVSRRRRRRTSAGNMAESSAMLAPWKRKKASALSELPNSIVFEVPGTMAELPAGLLSSRLPVTNQSRNSPVH